MFTAMSRQELEWFFGYKLGGIVREQAFERLNFTTSEYKYIVASLADSCLNGLESGKFWSVRDWRDIQAVWFQKQLRPLTAAENRSLGDQVLFFTGIVRGVEKVTPLAASTVIKQRNFSDRHCAALYNTGWCCRIGRNFYSSAAESSLSFSDSKLFAALAKHFVLWVIALSRIRQQDLLDRLSVS